MAGVMGSGTGHGARAQRQGDHGAIGRRAVDRLLEAPLGFAELRFCLRDLRLDVRDLVLVALAVLGQ